MDVGRPDVLAIMRDLASGDCDAGIAHFNVDAANVDRHGGGREFQGGGANNDLTDPNNDGENNLLEYATAQNPLTNSRSLTTIAKNGNVLDFTYTKNKSATDINYTVEWSDDLTNWSNAGVSEQTMNDNGAVQTVRASVAAGSKQRFIRLKVAY